MGKPAARQLDPHVCPMFDGPKPHVGGPLLPPFQTTVITGKMLQSRIGDLATCAGPPDSIAMGSAGVIVVGSPAARMGDMTVHGGNIVVGCPTVLIGEIGSASGGAGAGKTAQAASGASVFTAATTGAKAFIEPFQQATAYKNAHKDASAFCERCNR